MGQALSPNAIDLSEVRNTGSSFVRCNLLNRSPGRERRILDDTPSGWQQGLFQKPIDPELYAREPLAAFHCVKEGFC
jgi:hypothetical protein